jgi:hypothetical protein
MSQIIGDIDSHLATGHWPDAKEPWAFVTKRFGGIEPHFKDDKSAAFDITRSHIRHPEALGCLLMLIAAAQLLVAIQIGFCTAYLQHLTQIDWHGERAISFLQLGLRELKAPLSEMN